MESRRAQTTNRREQLLAAALRRFGRQGYTGATMKSIAADAGVAPGLLYHYFAGKEALLEAVIERYSLLPDLRDIVAGGQRQPVRELLLEIARRFDRLLSERRDLLQLLVREAVSQPVVQRVWQRMMNTGLGLFAAHLEQRIARGELRSHNARLLAQMVLSTVLLHHLRGDSAAPHLAELVDLALHGAALPDGAES